MFDFNKVKELRRKWERKKGERDYVMQEQLKVSEELKKLEELQENTEQASIIIQRVARATQGELEFHINSLVSLALESVFPDPYSFVLKFDIQRSQPEAYLWFKKGEHPLVRPRDATGGGVVDVAAFALRASLWQLGGTSPILILDEPFKKVSAEYRGDACRMLQQICSRLKLQCLTVTHDKTLIEAAQKVFRVTQRNRVAHVETVSDIK